VIQPTIPVVSLLDFADRRSRARFVQVLGEGLEMFGFVAVTDHSIDRALLQRVYASARDVFALPDHVKGSYEAPSAGRQRGYTPLGMERAKGRGVADLKEFWQIGRDLAPDHPYARSGIVPANRYPAEVPAFTVAVKEYFDRLERFAGILLEAIGDYLGTQPGFFPDMVRDGNTVLRILNYPDQDGPPPAGAVRAAAHEDINLITVMPASTRPGLELMTRAGDWMPVTTPPDVLICDTGDMVQLLTGGVLPATTHRVVNPAGGSDGGRLSLPLFVHPRPDYVITPFDASYGSPIGAQEFLDKRLREIGVA
jgi:isopenicillin N synthase-like dioxygenase